MGACFVLGHELDACFAHECSFREDKARLLMCPTSGWQCIDANGVAQGLFAAREMQAWNSKGHLGRDLLMRFNPNDLFPPPLEPFHSCPTWADGQRVAKLAAPLGRMMDASDDLDDDVLVDLRSRPEQEDPARRAVSTSCRAAGQGTPQELTLYHGTTKKAAHNIVSSSFKPSKGYIFGHGIYFTSSKEKAKMYGPVLLECVVSINRTAIVRSLTDELRFSWQDAGYDSVLMPANCGMVKSSPADVYCVHDPRCVRIVKPFRVRRCNLDSKCKFEFCRECQTHRHLLCA